ncbi:hypothetical protein MMC07_008252 [Pseudocyphellaria aurata]|nr:hypothetical protein [Pseudocyphellaria aurata]
MSAARRKTTRSISHAHSETSEVAETGSVQSSKPGSRRKRKSEKYTASIPKETYSYGTDIAGAHSQQLAAQAAMLRPVRDIETGVEQAARDAVGGLGRDLSVISEEVRTRGGVVGQYQVGGDLRGNMGDPSESDLTGIKTFGREDGDSLNSQSWNQSRAPSVDRDLYEQSNNLHSPWGSTWDSIRDAAGGSIRRTTWDSIRSSTLSILRSAGWLGWLFLRIFPIAAAMISLYLIASWYPIMRNLQSSGHNYSAPATSERSPLAFFEVERLGRRLKGLEDQVRKMPRTSETAARVTLRQINWLSYDLGARAVPHLCSPREFFQEEQAKAQPIRGLLKPRWWNFWGGQFESYDDVAREKPITMVKFEPIDYGPNSALQPWRENEPRYCTPGKLQLAVTLPRPVTPVDLVIEYYLKDEILAAGSAPKEVELWVPISDDAARAAVVLVVTKLYPDILASERSENARFLEQRTALDSKWVPVGRWTYDIYANEIEQRFHVFVDLDSHGVAVDEIVVRVNSNWANRDVTCLVRARMHGIDQSGIHEELAVG